MARVRESLVMENVPRGYYNEGRTSGSSAPKLVLVGISGIIITAAVIGTAVASSASAVSSGCSGNKQADILFFLDESGSIAQSDYLGLLRNISTFVGDLPISQTGIRVGIIEFSNFTNNSEYGNNVVDLFEFDSAVALQQRIGTLGHSGGFTEIASAFRFAKNEYFAQPANVRDVLHVFIYIGDGLFTGEAPFDALDDLKQLPIVGDFKFIFLPVLGIDGTLDTLFDASFAGEESRFFKAPQNDYSGVSDFLLNTFNLCI